MFWRMLVMASLLLSLFGGLTVPQLAVAQDATPSTSEQVDSTATAEPVDLATETATALATQPAAEPTGTATVEEASRSESGGTDETFELAAVLPFSESSYTVPNDGTTVTALFRFNAPGGLQARTLTFTAAAPLTITAAGFQCPSAPPATIPASDPHTITFAVPSIEAGTCDATVTFSVTSGTEAGTLTAGLNVSIAETGDSGSADVVIENVLTPTATATPSGVTAAFSQASYTVPNNGGTVKGSVTITGTMPVASTAFTLSTVPPVLFATIESTIGGTGGGGSSVGTLSGNSLPGNLVFSGPGFFTIKNAQISVPPGTPAGTLEDAVVLSIPGLGITVTADVVVVDVPTPTAIPSGVFDSASYTVPNDGTTVTATLSLGAPAPLTGFSLSATAPVTLVSGVLTCAPFASQPPLTPSDPQTMQISIPLLPGVTACTVTVTFSVPSGTSAETLVDALSLTQSGVGLIGTADVVVEDVSTPTATATAAQGAFSQASYSVPNDGTTVDATVNVTMPEAGLVVVFFVIADAPVTLVSGVLNCPSFAAVPMLLFGTDTLGVNTLSSPPLAACTFTATFSVPAGTPAGTLDDVLTVTVSGDGVIGTADVVVEDVSTPTATATATPVITAAFDQPSYMVLNDGTAVTAHVVPAISQADTPDTNFTISMPAPLVIQGWGFTCTGNAWGGAAPVGDHAMAVNMSHGPGTCPISITIVVPPGTPPGLLENWLTVTSPSLGVLASADVTVVDVATPTPEPTSTPTPEPTSTPTPEPTNTPTPEPTNTPTPEPTSTPTPEPTNTPTPEPTSTPTPEPTNTPTPEPTSTSTPLPTNTPTPEPTSIPTGTPEQSTVIISLSTEDGGAVPPNTTVCLGENCQQANGSFSLSGARALVVVNGATFTFAIAAGTYPLTVRDAAPYSDLATTVTVEAGAEITLPLTLSLAAVTPTATATSTPNPTNTAAPVTDLPNTGGSSLSADGPWRTAGMAGALAMLFLLAGLLLLRVMPRTRR